MVKNPSMLEQISVDNFYYEVICQFPPSFLEAIEDISLAATSNFACDGLTEFQMNEETVDHILGERSYCGGDIPVEFLDEVESSVDSSSHSYIYYFYGTNSETRALQFKDYVQSYYPELVITVSKKENADWNAEWKKHYSPIKVNETLEIVPYFFENYQSEAQQSLLIEPGMGFGTGSHETTFLCLEYLSQLKNLKINTVFDFGCGSGILGLASHLFFPKAHIDLFDIDEAALDNSRFNLEINKFDSISIRFLLPPQKDQVVKSDLVFANILLPILLEEKNYVLSKMNSGAFLITSGILNEQAQELIESYTQSGLLFKNKISKNDWSAVLFQMP